VSDKRGAYEAFQNAAKTSGRAEKVRKAKRLQQDIDRLYNTPADAPDSLREDVAALCDCADYEDAKEKLERL
jgi:hypothetical protein